MFNNAENKTFLINFSSLSVLQISNYIIPLISFPYIVRILGPSKFGLVNFAFAFIAYFSLLIDYGFSFSATRKVAKARKNSSEINKIFSTVLVIKLILTVLCFLILLAIINIIPMFKSNISLYYVAFLQVIGLALFPEWFFQGKEKMQYITIINVFVRSIWLICIFLFIRDESDYILYALLNGASLILIGFIGVALSVFQLGIRLILPTIDEVIQEMRKGWDYFISTIAISIYTNSSVFILGLFATNEIVGYYSAADKIRKAIQNILTITSQTIYPRISNLYYSNKNKGILLLKKYFRIGIVGWSILTIILIFSSNVLVDVIAGGQYREAVKVFNLLLFLPFIIFFSNYYGIQILVATGHVSIFSKITMVAGILFLLLSFVLVPLLLDIGTAITILFTELIVSLWTWAEVKKRNYLVMPNEI